MQPTSRSKHRLPPHAVSGSARLNQVMGCLLVCYVVERAPVHASSWQLVSLWQPGNWPTEEALLLFSVCDERLVLCVGLSGFSHFTSLFHRMVKDLLVLRIRTKFNIGGLLVHPARMPWRKVENFTGADHLFGTVRVTNMDTPFQDIAPVGTMARIVRQPFEQRARSVPAGIWP